MFHRSRVRRGVVALERGDVGGVVGLGSDPSSAGVRLGPGGHLTVRVWWLVFDRAFALGQIRHTCDQTDHRHSQAQVLPKVVRGLLQHGRVGTYSDSTGGGSGVRERGEET